MEGSCPFETQRKHEEMRLYGFDPKNPDDVAEWDMVTDSLPPKYAPSDYNQDEFELGSPGRKKE